MKHLYSFFVLFCVTLILAIPGCRKSDRDEDTNTNAAEDNATAEHLFNDVLHQVHHVVTEDSANLYKTRLLDNCIDTVILTTTGGVFPKTASIDFGSSNGSACTDGRLRRGKIIATFSGRYADSATVVNITLSQYHVNDLRVEGTVTLTNNGRGSGGNLVFTHNVSGGRISIGTKRIDWDATRNREWISGESTLAKSDDSFTITGTATGRNSSGNSFSVTVTDALKNDLSCYWLTGGKMEIKPNNLATRKVDFGGGCDDKASVTINGTEYEIEFR